MYEGNAARKLSEEDLAPDIQELAQERLKAKRESRPSNILRFPAERLAARAAENLPIRAPAMPPAAKNNEPRELNNPVSQRAAAGRLKQLTRQRQAAYKQASKVQTAKSLADKYKQIRNILRIAKVGTGLTAAGLIITVLVAHAEWIYHKFNNNYPFTKLDKILTLAADGIIVAALVVLMFFAYLQLHPLEAAKIGWKLLNI